MCKASQLIGCLLRTFAPGRSVTQVPQNQAFSLAALVASFLLPNDNSNLLSKNTYSCNSMGISSSSLPKPAHTSLCRCLFPDKFTTFLCSSILLDRRRRLPLPRGAARTSAGPLGLLRHACFAVQLLVGVDHVGFFGRHLLAVDHAEAGCCWDVQGALGGEGGGGAAGHTRC